MKKIILTISLLASFLFTNGQDIEKTELNIEDLEYLQKNINKGWSSKEPDETLINSTKNNLITYQFEIVYNDTVVYRGNIDKPSYGQITMGIYRTRVQFCLEYDVFDAETKLELAENKKIKLITTESGNKYYYTDFYELFEMDYKKGLIVNDRLSSKIHFKFYKLTEK
ncbi:hypothetical protein [Algibacter pectinivorans]|uniref:Uncharacterized protein n=1 Tax=Algibacter pectinivorans TaxID=870482 RepID=A0A1I1RLK2_9FLAO|nr:hypothetical protein [Algibacter pectinivorans]SFD35154.1 hypothetical protein SAMN04487987_11087 [Algibacter pectinivorans]